MDSEIILDRGESHVMKLDEAEQAMLNEIQLESPAPQTMSRGRPPIRPPGGSPPYRKPQMYQEDISEFANPMKQNAPHRHNRRIPSITVKRKQRMSTRDPTREVRRNSHPLGTRP